MRKRIVILNQFFDPEPTFKGLLFAKSLKAKGFDVEVITGFPNYPGGQVYDGYKLRPYKKEEVEGIKVHRLYLFPSHDDSKIKRILNYGSFAFSSLMFGLFYFKKNDLLYVYHPPLTTGIVAAILKKIRGVHFVYDIQDLWPDTLIATGMLNNSRILKVVGSLAGFVYKKATNLVVLSDGFKNKLIERDVDPTKISVIYNWADERYIKAFDLKSQPSTLDKNTFNLLYAGNLGKAQDLQVLVNAAELLKKNTDIKITLMGNGQEKKFLNKLIIEKQLTNITIEESVPVTQVSLYLLKADALFIHLKRDPLFEITIPGKTQAYLASGKPVLMAVEGNASEIITKSKSGIVVEPSNPRSIADGILEMAEMEASSLRKLGENGRDFYIKNMSLNSGVEKFSKIFNLIEDKNAK